MYLMLNIVVCVVCNVGKILFCVSEDLLKVDV